MSPFGIRLLPRLFEGQRRETAYRVFTVTFTFLIYTAYHMSRKPLSVVKNVLHHNINTSQLNSSEHYNWAPFDTSKYLELLGGLDYAFLFAYTIGIFFSGYIAERMNLRYFLSAGMITSGVFTVAFGLGYFLHIHFYYYFVIVQIICGILSSSGWPSVVACMGNWFAQGRRGLIMGIWNAHTSVGNILGSILAGVWVTSGWGWSFVVPGIIIAALGLLCLLFFVPHPHDVGCRAPTLPDEKLPIAKSSETSKSHKDQGEAITVFDALRIPGVVEFSLSLFFGKLVAYTLLYWLPQYIHSTTLYGPQMAAYLSTLFDVGGILGGIAAGYMSDVTGASATVCAVQLSMAAPLLYIYHIYGTINYTTNVGATTLSISVLLMLCGFMINGSYALITTAVSADLGTHPSLRHTKALATVSAIIDGMGSFGAAVGPLLTGIIAETGWVNVFYMLIVADLISLVVLTRLIVQEWRPQRRHGYSVF